MGQNGSISCHSINPSYIGGASFPMDNFLLTILSYNVTLCWQYSLKYWFDQIKLILNAYEFSFFIYSNITKFILLNLSFLKILCITNECHNTSLWMCLKREKNEIKSNNTLWSFMWQAINCFIQLIKL